MQSGSAEHACVVLSIMLSLEGCYVSGAASNHLVNPRPSAAATFSCLHSVAVGVLATGDIAYCEIRYQNKTLLSKVNASPPQVTISLYVQDLSAKFAGIIFGLTNGLSSIVEAFSIYGTGLILDSQHSWPLVFEVVAGVNVLGGLFYIFFASSKPQSW